MTKSPIHLVAFYFTGYYPQAIALIFLSAILFLAVPQKGAFTARALVALVVATLLAHVNRIFHLYPAHLLFPSGHTTFCFGLALSLGMLRPWTLSFTLPAALYMAYALVELHYHQIIDVIGAFPLVIVVYGAVHYFWRLPSDSPLLDRVKVSA
jgi:membrane-associated phospholipid phosphatase